MGSCSSCNSGCGGGNYSGSTEGESCGEVPYDPKKAKKLSKHDEMMTYW